MVTLLPCPTTAPVGSAAVLGLALRLAFAGSCGMPSTKKEPSEAAWASSRCCVLGYAEADIVVAVGRIVVVDAEHPGIVVGVPVAAPDEGIARLLRVHPVSLMELPFWRAVTRPVSDQARPLNRLCVQTSA